MKIMKSLILNCQLSNEERIEDSSVESIKRHEIGDDFEEEGSEEFQSFTEIEENEQENIKDSEEEKQANEENQDDEEEQTY